MPRHQIIVNPLSGRGNGEKIIPELQKLLSERGVTFDLCRTERPWHAALLAEQAAAEGAEVVVAVGGDGTANEVLNGLVRARLAGKGQAAMGVIPAGRGNDFSFGIGMPPDLAAACTVIGDGHHRWIDVGHVQGGDYPQGHYFGNGVGIGFDAVVGFEALKLKRLHGFPSYIVAALKTIFLYFDAPTLEIELDDQRFVQPCLMVSVMNGRRMGGGFMMAPHGVPDDGLFDLCIAAKVTRPQVLALIPRFMQGSQASHPAIRTVRTRTIKVTALQGTLPAHADGETLCVAGKQLEMRILPHMLEVVSPVGEKAA